MIILIILGVLVFSIWLASCICTAAEAGKNKWGFGTYKYFKREYIKNAWDLEPEGKKFFWNLFVRSRWDQRNHSELHAGINIFNGKGMVLMPISWILSFIYVFKETKNCEGYGKKYRKDKVLLINWRTEE